MPISYAPLFSTLKKKNLKLADIQRVTGISLPTLAKFNKNESVSLSTLEQIANHLNCDIEDIVTFNSRKNITKQAKLETSAALDIFGDKYKLVLTTPTGQKIGEGEITIG